MPTAATELGGLDWYGWAFRAFMLMNLIGAIAAGHAADRGNGSAAMTQCHGSTRIRTVSFSHSLGEVGAGLLVH
jgi:MFS family permease